MSRFTITFNHSKFCGDTWYMKSIVGTIVRSLRWRSNFIHIRKQPVGVLYTRRAIVQATYEYITTSWLIEIQHTQMWKYRVCGICVCEKVATVLNGPICVLDMANKVDSDDGRQYVHWMWLRQSPLTKQRACWRPTVSLAWRMMFNHISGAPPNAV